MSRTIHLITPLMHGPDVERLQHDVNGHLKAWGVPQAARINPDGVYGQLSRMRTLEVCYGLGIAHSATERGIGPIVQSRLHSNKRLTASELVHMHNRTNWRHRFAARLSGGHAGQAVAYAKSMAGKHIVEHPSGSNLGPYITNWERLAGYHVPPGVSWCGCFVNACLVAGGLHSQTWGIGYVPSIEAYAQAGHNGWKWHSADISPKAGWIVTFGQGIGEHTELVVEDGWPLRTVGGNTSPNDGGSFNNGGGVYYHNYSTHIGFPRRGFAAPNYN